MIDCLNGNSRQLVVSHNTTFPLAAGLAATSAASGSKAMRLHRQVGCWPAAFPPSERSLEAVVIDEQAGKKVMRNSNGPAAVFRQVEPELRPQRAGQPGGIPTRVFRSTEF